MKTLILSVWIGLAALFAYVINHALPGWSPDLGETSAGGSETATGAAAGAIDWSKGGAFLFSEKCSRCHSKKLEQRLTGPPLYKVQERIPGGDWIYRWVHNSTAVIRSGDTHANQVYAEYGKVQMDAFPDLSEADIDQIMEFIAVYEPAK